MNVNIEILLNDLTDWLEGDLTDKSGILYRLSNIKNREEFINNVIMTQDYYSMRPYVDDLFKEIDSYGN